MVDVVIALSIVLGATVVLSLGESRANRRILWAALAYHLLVSWVIVEMTTEYYEGGDLLGYHFVGAEAAELLSGDFGRWAVPLLRYTLGQDVIVPLSTVHVGNTTASTVGLYGWVMWMTQTRSIYALAIISSFLALYGQWMVFLTLERRFPEISTSLLAVCVLFVPSTTYWASGPTKEAFAVFGLGLLIAAVDLIDLRKSPLKASVFFVVGAVSAGLTKPYLLPPLAIAVFAYWYLSAARRRDGRFRIRGPRLIAAAALAIVSIVLLGELFPRFAYDQLATGFAGLQEYGGQGGSGYFVGDPAARTLAQQLVFAPIGLVFVFLRPTLFEVQNVPMAASAIETGICILLVLRVVFRAGFSRPLRWMLRDPNLAVACVFVLMFAVSIGLSTTNFGTLSRYRAPMMPFYATMLLALNTRLGFRRVRIRRPMIETAARVQR
jgi:hypothetical protein